MIKKLLIPLICVMTGFVLAQETTPQAEPELETAAVLDFEGLGITKMEAVALTQRLSGELVNTQAIILVERGQMSDILEEQGFQQSGCTSVECAVEVGALLGVQKMITGSFGKIGSSYTIEAKIFSVGTGRTEKAVNKTYKGEVDGLITQVELIAWELMGLEPPDDLKVRAGIPIAKKEPEQKPTEEPEKVVKEKGSKKWIIYTSALAVAGGVTYYYLMQQEEAPQELQLPPDPPSAHKIVFGGKY